ncbi:hypothetical protein ACFYPG_03220 [Micromonospora sp. NPDC005553]|uniref:hypothetical protein n=1 Tax=Micromonospora sp. NPDC005553 TaxID=3364232 RepID=UPI0036880873
MATTEHFVTHHNSLIDAGRALTNSHSPHATSFMPGSSELSGALPKVRKVVLDP